MPRLLSILAARTGTLLNAAEISRGSGIVQTTLKRYLSLLETLFLFQELPAWSINVGKRYVKMPKAFLSDTGLAAHLLHLTDERLSQEPVLWGGLLKTLSAWNCASRPHGARNIPSFFIGGHTASRKLTCSLKPAAGWLGSRSRPEQPSRPMTSKACERLAVDAGQALGSRHRSLLRLRNAALWRKSGCHADQRTLAARIIAPELTRHRPFEFRPGIRKIMQWSGDFGAGDDAGVLDFNAGRDFGVGKDGQLGKGGLEKTAEAQPDLRGAHARPEAGRLSIIAGCAGTGNP